MVSYQIELLDEAGAQEALEGLASVLCDCVEGGASVGFVLPFGMEDARSFFRDGFPAVRSGGTLLYVARQAGQILGTVQVGLRQFPNQPHRADLKKLLVHRDARGKGVASALMAAAEAGAVAAGKSLLVLDTATGSPAEALYRKLGWEITGVVPNYALYPDGSYCGTTIYYKQIAAFPSYQK